MRKWTEQEFLHHGVWYHATSKKFFNKILADGIDVSVNKEKELDFGYGFYLTPNVEWAKKYAQGYVDGIIFEFHFTPISLLDESKLKYKFYGELNNEFANFVFNNRMYYNNYSTNCVHSYALVGGVMSDGQQYFDFTEYRKGIITKEELFRRINLPKEDWQLLIHEQKLADKLIPFTAFDLKGDTHDVSSYNTDRKGKDTLPCS